MSALDDIHAAFAEPIAFTPAATAVGAAITAVPTFDAAPSFEGPGGSARTTSFEVRYADLAVRPKKQDRILHAGVEWEVTDITARDDVEAWQCIVERAA